MSLLAKTHAYFYNVLRIRLRINHYKQNELNINTNSYHFYINTFWDS